MAPSNAKPRIVIESVPNPECRLFHTAYRISDYSILHFSAPIQDYNERDLRDVGEIGASLTIEICAIGGVSEVFIKPFELHVTKALAFEWNELEPQLIERLVATYNRTMESKLTLVDFDISRRDNRSRLQSEDFLGSQETDKLDNPSL